MDVHGMMSYGGSIFVVRSRLILAVDFVRAFFLSCKRSLANCARYYTSL
jgi:hypothetical protein